MLKYIQYIFNIIYWTTPTKKTGLSLFGGINKKGGVFSFFNIYSNCKKNAIGFIISGVALTESGVAGGGFLNLFSYSKKGEAGGILISIISLAPKGSTYGTFTLFAQDKVYSSEHYFCVHHIFSKFSNQSGKSKKRLPAH